MKTYKRQFQTHIGLYPYEPIVEEIIAGIENDTINVFRPDDEDALVHIQDEGGAALLDARATLPVSVREWLPVVCQFIKWDCCVAAHECVERDNALAYYDSNASEVIWPEGEDDPAGPGALVAGIVLRQQQCIGDTAKDAATTCNRLRFILAHELVHAFHAMRFVVPAFMDWPAFWQNVLTDGTSCDILNTNHGYRTGFVDHYGTEFELAEVADFWPSQAQKWFDASRC